MIPETAGVAGSHPMPAQALLASSCLCRMAFLSWILERTRDTWHFSKGLQRRVAPAGEDGHIAMRCCVAATAMRMSRRTYMLNILVVLNTAAR